MPVFFLLISTLVTVTVLGGGVLPFTIGAVAVILSTASVIFFLRQPSSVSTPLPLLSATLVLLATATLFPLPLDLASSYGSPRIEQHAIAAKAIREACDLGIIGDGTSTSLFALTQNRAGTARMLLLLIAGISISALCAGLPGPWKERYLRCLVLLTVVIAAVSFISQWIFPQGKNIWWLFPVPHGAPVGCFINRNHFGGFAAMMCSPALFLAADSLANRRFLYALSWLAGFAILSTATLLSLSKGAWLALSVSMVFTFLVMLLRRQFILASLLPLLLLTAGAAVTATHSAQLRERVAGLPRLLHSQSAETRMSTWKDSLAILHDYPLAGTGANAFRMVFPQYRKAATRKPFEHAENEYVQVPVEFGLPATAVILAILLCFARQWRSDLVAKKNVTILLCTAGMLVTVAAHSFTDYAIRIPLYFLTVTSMTGLVLSTAPDKSQRPAQRSPLAIALSVIMLMIAASVSCMGERIYQLDSSDYMKTAPAPEICRALSWSPVSWQAWYRLGTLATAKGSENACRFGEQCLARAAVYDPKNYKLWEELAKLRFSIQDLDGALDANRHMKELRSWKQIKELEEPQTPR